MTSPVRTWRKHKTLKTSLGKIGKVIAWTRVYAAPEGFGHLAPYIVCMVEFGKNDKMVAQLVDYTEEALRIGQKVVCVVRRGVKAGPSEVIEYAIKVKLV